MRGLWVQREPGWALAGSGCGCCLWALTLTRSPLPLHRADIALIGLAVMGQNLILNMNDHGFVVS